MRGRRSPDSRRITSRPATRVAERRALLGEGAVERLGVDLGALEPRPGVVVGILAH